jgi:tRNA threonylcarbamoyl adenosine modification protein YeaZ
MTIMPALTLAIEAAISGGSLSIMEGGREIAGRIGSSNISRAEDLLAEVDEMLTENGRKISDVNLVAVSAGPGSFTGIRIGLATALGLTTGLGIEMASESALRSMANDHRGYAELLVAIPVGRDTVCYQVFDTAEGITERSDPRTEREATFLSSITGDGERCFLLQRELFVKSGRYRHVIDFGRNIAAAVGRLCDSQPRPRTAPLFISKDQ